MHSGAKMFYLYVQNAPVDSYTYYYTDCFVTKLKLEKIK